MDHYPEPVEPSPMVDVNGLYDSNFLNPRDHEWDASRKVSDPFSVKTGYKEQIENLINDLYPIPRDQKLIQNHLPLNPRPSLIPKEP